MDVYQMKNCLICGKEFNPTRSDQLYDSAACRQRAKRIGISPSDIPSTSTGVYEGDPEPQKKLDWLQQLASEKGFSLVRASELPPTTYIPTGHARLDALIKGFPRKRITEIYGQPSVGKTTLMLQTIANLPKDISILYIDMENALSGDWLDILGVSAQRMTVINPLVLEDAIVATVSAVADFDLIVFDSVASALFKTEENSEVGDHNIGVKAKLMTSFMRRLIGPLSRSNCAVVFINQMKPSIGDMYAPKWYTPGGRALEYTSSLRLELVSNKADRITQGGEKVGKKVTAKITKSKVGTPDREATFEISYAPDTAQADF